MEDRIGRVRGQYRDILRDWQKHVLFDSDWVSNTIVDECRILLAGLMTKRTIDGDSIGSGSEEMGILHLVVGEGDPEWDDSEEIPQVPEDTDILVKPYEGNPLTELNFSFLKRLNPELEEYEESSDPTAILQITAVLKPGYPVTDSDSYPLREFGLFGNFDADPKNLRMINCVRHPRIDKHLDAELTRTIMLFF